MLTTFSKWFWSESFWLPTQYTWEDLKSDPAKNLYIPQIYDLWIVLPITLCFLILRQMFDRTIAIPIGRILKQKETHPRRPEPNSVLEAAFINFKKKVPDQKAIKELCEKCHMKERQLLRWWRRRRIVNQPSAMSKFKETFWRFTVYSSLLIYGFVSLWDKSWFWVSENCWVEYPKQNVPTDIYWYYIIELGFYFSLIITVLRDTKRKDFYEMLVHHAVTVALMFFSWANNFVRIGSLVLLVHDCVDPFLEFAKLANYAKWQKVCDSGFVVFVIVWIITRLIIFPIKILWSAVFECRKGLGFFYSHSIFLLMLFLLQILHIFWSWLVLKMVHRYIFSKVEKDERSETEPDSTTDDEKAKSNGRSRNTPPNLRSRAQTASSN